MTDAPRPDGPPAPDGPTLNPSVSSEPSDANVRGVVVFAGALVAVAVVVHLALWGMFVLLRHQEDREKESHYPLSAGERGELPQTEFGSPATGNLPAGPRLEGLNLAEPQHDVGRRRSQGTAQEKNDEEEQTLSRSGTDKDGHAHISIEQAMRLVAEGYKPHGHAPAPVRYDAGIPGTGGGSNSGRDLPEAKR
jgi:hypothetical protein